MNPFRFLTLALLAALLPLPLQAHSELTRTQPAAGAALEHAPEALTLQFSEAVSLVEVTLLDGRHQAVDIGFSAPQKAAETFSVALPSLPDDGYTVQWTAVGEEDDHTVLGDFSFSVGAGQVMPSTDGDHHGREMEHGDHDEHGHHD